MTRAIAKISMETPISTIKDVPSRFARRRMTGISTCFRRRRKRWPAANRRPGIAAAYSVISIRRKVKPMPLRPNALAGSDSAGTDTRLLAANTAFWS